jgi:hypothetical protein
MLRLLGPTPLPALGTASLMVAAEERVKAALFDAGKPKSAWRLS